MAAIRLAGRPVDLALLFVSGTHLAESQPELSFLRGFTATVAVFPD